jgi:integrase
MSSCCRPQLLQGWGVRPAHHGLGVVQERLGHARVEVTLNTYSHVLPTMQKEAVGKVDRLLG